MKKTLIIWILLLSPLANSQGNYCQKRCESKYKKCVKNVEHLISFGKSAVFTAVNRCDRNKNQCKRNCRKN